MTVIQELTSIREQLRLASAAYQERTVIELWGHEEYDGPVASPSSGHVRRSSLRDDFKLPLPGPSSADQLWSSAAPLWDDIKPLAGPSSTFTRTATVADSQGSPGEGGMDDQQWVHVHDTDADPVPTHFVSKKRAAPEDSMFFGFLA